MTLYIAIDIPPMDGKKEFLKPVNQLPTAAEAELPPDTVTSVNGAVLKALERDEAKTDGVTFTPDDRAAIGRHLWERWCSNSE